MKCSGCGMSDWELLTVSITRCKNCGTLATPPVRKELNYVNSAYDYIMPWVWILGIVGWMLFLFWAITTQ